MRFEEAFAEAPLVAILRGIMPKDVPAIGDALYRAGVRIVEVPMNSPDPLESIGLLAKNFDGRLICGAGTVLNIDWVDSVCSAGGRIIVAPNTNPEIIQRASARGAVPIPGFATPTEALASYKAGARYLKLFPAITFGTIYLKQLLAVLPPDAVVLPVGGISSTDIPAWWAAGARGFGVGSEIYRPGQSPDITYAQSKKFLSALNQAKSAA